MRVQKIYITNRKYSQLRVKIDNKAYKCGNSLGQSLFINKIDSEGYIEVTNLMTHFVKSYRIGQFIEDGDLFDNAKVLNMCFK